MMKLKKKPSKNLNRKKTLFFQIGLILSLTMILVIVEWKTEAKTSIVNDTVSYHLLEHEEMPVVTIPEKQLKPLPKPKPDTEDFIIDEKEPETEESPKPVEPTPKFIPLDLDEIEPIEKDPIKDIGFEFIEDAPIFPGCELYTDNKQRKSCMSEQLQKFIQKEFNRDLASDLGLKGINRIYVSFKINTRGEAEFINARAPHPKLKQESQRVIEQLPKMQPGKQRGTPVNVIFALPITFKVSN